MNNTAPPPIDVTQVSLPDLKMPLLDIDDGLLVVEAVVVVAVLVDVEPPLLAIITCCAAAHKIFTFANALRKSTLLKYNEELMGITTCKSSPSREMYGVENKYVAFVAQSEPRHPLAVDDAIESVALCPTTMRIARKHFINNEREKVCMNADLVE